VTLTVCSCQSYENSEASSFPAFCSYVKAVIFALFSKMSSSTNDVMIIQEGGRYVVHMCTTQRV